MIQRASDLPRRPSLDRASLVLLAAIGAFVALDAWMLAMTDYQASGSAVVRESLNALSWIVVGVVAMSLRRPYLARRILALALVLVADFRRLLEPGDARTRVGDPPAVLIDFGVVPALSALATRLGPRVRLDVPAPVRRQSAEVEAAAYFSASEAITNALKHAAPADVEVWIVERGGRLVVRVVDNGPGEADTRGSGLLGVRDRLASVDGTLSVASRPGEGTELTMEIPCE